MLKKESGSSLFYVLIALLAVAFIGSSLLKLSTSDHLSQIHYRHSESARNTAKSGIIAALSFIRNPVNKPIVESILEDWRDNGNKALLHHKKLISHYMIDSSVAQLSDKQFFNVEIIAFDVENKNITLRSEGTGTGNSKATITSVYKLDGFTYNDTLFPHEALHMGGGGDEFYRAIRVHGDTYINGSGKFYDPLLQKSIFNGRVFVDYVEKKSCLFKGVEFRDTTYFAGNIEMQVAPSLFDHSIFGPPCTFLKSVGSESYLKIGKNAGFSILEEGILTNGVLETTDKDSIELIGSSIAKGRKGINHNYNSNNQMSTNNNFNKFFDTNSKLRIEEVDYIPIAELLNVKKTNEINFSFQELKKHSQPLSSLVRDVHVQINGNEMNNIYESFTPKLIDHNQESWAIVEYDQANFFDTGGIAFNNKVVWIINDSVKLDSRFYEHSNTANTVIYVGTGGVLVGIGGCKKFRGFIYSETTKMNTYKAIGGSTFNGAIYQKNTGGTLKIEGHPVNPGGYFDVFYDEKVLRECAALGLFQFPDDSSKNNIIISDAGLKVKLLSQLIH